MFSPPESRRGFEDELRVGPISRDPLQRAVGASVGHGGRHPGVHERERRQVEGQARIARYIWKTGVEPAEGGRECRRANR